MCDTEIGGQQIKEGDRVLVSWAAANRDEKEFACPAQFDLDRASNRHIAFGAGPHRCAGSNLARMNIRIAVGELVAASTTSAWRTVPSPSASTRPTAAARGADHVHARPPARRVGRDEPPCYPNGRIVSCSGGPAEEPFDGDVLLDDDRIVGCSVGRAPSTPPRGSSTWRA